MTRHNDRAEFLQSALNNALAELAAAKAERDALAAALDETDRAFERFAIHHGSCCGVHNSTDEAAPGECILCDVDRGARRHGDYADILAARDARMKREGAREALRGLPPKHERLFGSLEYIRGWDCYRDRVDAAIAALEQKGEQG